MVSPLPGFTEEQWESLGQMFAKQTSSTPSTSKPIPERLSGKKQTGEVILDTGASHHMTGDKNLLTNLRNIISCPINFADGSQVFAMCSGTLPLSSTIILENDAIGAGEERDGVYVYRDVTAARVHKVQAVEDHALWHRRLGHPSFQVLSFLPMDVFPFREKNSVASLDSAASQVVERYFDDNDPFLPSPIASVESIPVETEVAETEVVETEVVETEVVETEVVETEEVETEEVATNSPPPVLRRSQRERQQSVRLHGYETYNAKCVPDKHHSPVLSDGTSVFSNSV
ncbi:unnamed protein product, partial [Arabidopsis halleri]